ncbi:S100 calcium binding protein U [Labrus bergylta]|uniref:S100 calcium binding protein U n=1 Tax=Labrus bergylta TaxID=56723 RepID=A0A3Q3GXF5_9LABR|nr:cilia- and flagella-associated protein 91-like [Labrus bergylta]XP_020504250.1 cilia- and flagella-associated protein 91-like [Labrus bergylta]
MEDAIQTLVKVYLKSSKGKECLGKKDFQGLVKGQLSNILSDADSKEAVNNLMTQELDANQDGKVGFEEYMQLVGYLAVSLSEERTRAKEEPAQNAASEQVVLTTPDKEEEKPEANAEAKDEAKPEANQEPKAEATAEIKVNANADGNIEVKVEAKADGETEPEATKESPTEAAATAVEAAATAAATAVEAAATAVENAVNEEEKAEETEKVEDAAKKLAAAVEGEVEKIEEATS